MQPLLVSPQEIRGIVTMAEAVEAVRLGFREWGENPQLNALMTPTVPRAPGRRK